MTIDLDEDDRCFKILNKRLIIMHEDGSEFIYQLSKGEGLSYYHDGNLDRLIREGMISGFREVCDTDLSKDDILQIPKYWDELNRPIQNKEYIFILRHFILRGD